jgi:hypothetical protein
MTPQEMNEFANAFYGDLMTVYQKAFTENVQPMFGLPVELLPKVGDGANRKGGISWRCSMPPLLH